MTALLVVGHGTRSAAGVAQFHQLVDLLADRAPGAVAGGFIELSSPPLSAAVAGLAAGGAEEVAVVPLVLVAAGHAKGDIPGSLARERGRHPRLRFRYGRPLGPHATLVDLLDARAGEVVGPERPRTAVLLVGRGSTDPAGNAEVALTARLLQEGRGFAFVETAFVSLAEPGVAAGLERCRRLGAEQVVVLPYFLFPGVLPDRVAAQAAAWAAEHPELPTRTAAVLGPSEPLADLVLERAREALAGEVRMSCDVCVHRVALPGFAHKVGAPQTPHHHPDEPAGAAAHPSGPAPGGRAGGSHHDRTGHDHGPGHDHAPGHDQGAGLVPAVAAIAPELRHHGDRELGPGLLDAAVNVASPGPPGWLAELLGAALADLGRYPDPAPARSAVAARHGRDPAEVLLLAGAAEAFTLLARALRPRHAVVVHPQFTEPEAALLAAGHRVRRVVLAGWESSDTRPFGLDPAAVPASADLVVVGNPTNPTSVLHPASVLAALARPGRVLVVDEAFMDAVPGEPDSLAARSDLPGLVVVRSLTKTWGLAGLRAGYLLAPAPLVGALAAAQPPWAVSSPALAATLACTSPRARAETTAWAVGLATQRARMAAGLGAIPGARVVPGAAAPFLLAELPNADLVRTTARAAGLAVRTGATFPGLGTDWLRVSVRARGDVNERVLAGLAAAAAAVRAAGRAPAGAAVTGAQR